MADIGTYDKFKNWLVVILFGLVVSLLGMVAAENREKIARLEQRDEAKSGRIERLYERVSALEASQQSQRDEMFRRLDRIEDKLDSIGSTKYRKAE